MQPHPSSDVKVDTVIKVIKNPSKQHVSGWCRYGMTYPKWWTLSSGKLRFVLDTLSIISAIFPSTNPRKRVGNPLIPFQDEPNFSGEGESFISICPDARGLLGSLQWPSSKLACEQRLTFKKWIGDQKPSSGGFLFVYKKNVRYTSLNHFSGLSQVEFPFEFSNQPGRIKM